MLMASKWPLAGIVTVAGNKTAHRAGVGTYNLLTYRAGDRGADERGDSHWRRKCAPIHLMTRIFASAVHFKRVFAGHVT